MSGYVDRALSPTEVVIARASPHWAIFIAPAFWIVVSLALLPLLIVTIPWLIIRILAFKFTELAVTNKRVIAKTGVIRTNTVDVALPKVEGVTYSQGILGRMLGYGSIFVRGTGSGFVPITFISYPEQFKAEVDRKLHE